MTPEEEKFWRAVDERAERKARQLFESSVNPQLQLGAAELARIKVAEFRRSHPDVKPNSPEEMEIARKINSGYDIDDAYWSIMGPRGIKNAETQATKKVQQQMSAKKQANVENKSIPSSAPSLPSRKLSLKEQIEANYDKMERGEL
jgi:tRNA splicing ligase